MTLLPAAAVHKGDKVVLPNSGDEDGGLPHTMIVTQVQNSTPRAGLITWVDEDGMEEVVEANQKVEVLELLG